MTGRARAVLAIAVSVTACSGRATVAPSVPREAQRDVQALTRRVTIHYEIQGRPFPLPLVSGTIAGRPAMMLVDTGADSHVVAGWLARKLALPMEKLGDVATDHVGRTFASFRIDHPSIALDGWGPLAMQTASAIEVPEAFERLGIGAIISPQRLDEEGDATLLDLAKGELRSAWWDKAVVELQAGSELVHAGDGQTCEDEDGPAKGLWFVVPATIDARSTRLLVDTGAPQSDVFATSAPGKELDGRSTASSAPMYAASGRVAMRVLKGAHVMAGSFATAVDVDLIEGGPDSTCPRDGALAMDVLRSCTLLLGRTQIRGRCAPRR